MTAGRPGSPCPSAWLTTVALDEAGAPLTAGGLAARETSALLSLLWLWMEAGVVFKRHHGWVNLFVEPTHPLLDERVWIIVSPTSLPVWYSRNRER